MSSNLPAEDGYDLWLRYRPLDAGRYRVAAITVEGDSPTLDAAKAELRRGLSEMAGHLPELTEEVVDGGILLTTPAPVPGLGPEGYVVRTAQIQGRSVTLIAGNTDLGVLYGVFRYLSLIQTGRSVDDLDIVEAPKLKIRILDHWDNLDGTVERGYAGRSIWDWPRLPQEVSPRYTDYARANASVGINGAVLNNVNAQAASLTSPYLEKTRVIADVLRPYGVRVYLAARFSSPIELGGLATADPLDPAVRSWWRAKADEIYSAIPDFGGFVVKANSEGQPGPGDYGRTHADGANMMADAVAPHGGIVMWRAFVYAAEDPEDRAKQAYAEFKPLDGQFAPNVLVQIKNGPIDFQPREPFHPLFGAMPQTPQMLEVMITKEYLGQKTHLVYSTQLFEEVLQSPTHLDQGPATVSQVIQGLGSEPGRLTGMAGVANVGADRDWTGSIFNQSDWYGFGRLAWDPDASAREVAEDWVKMTFTTDPVFVQPVVDIMIRSREAVVDYMTPMGLHHQMATAHHYGPGPWVADLDRPEWNPTYYAQADSHGVGFDRTRSGSDALSQYAPGAAHQWEDPRKIDPKFLLWFHRVPWTFRLASGRTLWEELAIAYDRGVEEVASMRRTWATLAQFVDDARFESVSRNLQIQFEEAKWWRDAMLSYFVSRSGLALPPGHPQPEHDLAYYMSLTFPDKR